VAVRQGALQLRDLHEDTTGPGQEGGREGERDFLKLCVDSTGEHYLSNNSHHTLFGVEMSLCGDGVHKWQRWQQPPKYWDVCVTGHFRSAAAHLGSLSWNVSRKSFKPMASQKTWWERHSHLNPLHPPYLSPDRNQQQRHSALLIRRLSEKLVRVYVQPSNRQGHSSRC